jgi:hypothetical protein
VLHQVKYSVDGPVAFPPKKAAESMEYSMATSDLPEHAQCFTYPWNGPDGMSPEEAAAKAAAEAVGKSKTKAYVLAARRASAIAQAADPAKDKAAVVAATEAEAASTNSSMVPRAFNRGE